MASRPERGLLRPCRPTRQRTGVHHTNPSASDTRLSMATRPASSTTASGPDPTCWAGCPRGAESRAGRPVALLPVHDALAWRAMPRSCDCTSATGDEATPALPCGPAAQVVVLRGCSLPGRGQVTGARRARDGSPGVSMGGTEVQPARRRRRARSRAREERRWGAPGVNETSRAVWMRPWKASPSTLPGYKRHREIAAIAPGQIAWMWTGRTR